MTLKFSQTDHKLKKVISKKDLSDSRIREYDIAFKEIYDLTGHTPSELIEIAKKEQKPFYNNGIIEVMEMEDRAVEKIQDQYYDYLKNKKVNGRKLMDRTIQTKLSVYRAFLKANKIEMPEKIKITIPKQRLRDKDIPTWNDVNNAINLCKSPRDSAIIAFAVSTGLRISDILNLKLKDLIEACEIYFDKDEDKTLNVLLNKNADNIVPCWEIVAQKTDNDDTPNLTVTFNTPEASRYIWFYLKDRFNRSKKKNENYVVDMEEPLFKSQRGGHLNPISAETHFRNINARLGGEKDRNGVYVKFRLHNLRKLFKTTCRRNISSIQVQSDKTYEGDVISLFTGHATPNNPLAYVYEAVEDDSHDSHIRKVYQALIPYLSIQPTDVKDVKTKQYQELEKKNELLKKQFEAEKIRMQREMDEQKRVYEEKISSLEGVNSALASQVTGIQNQLDNIVNANDIKTIQEYISDNELVNKYNLASIIIDYYKEDIKKTDFEGVTTSYIDDLITTAFNTNSSLQSTENIDGEYMAEDSWKQISSQIDYLKSMYIENKGYKLSESQDKKISEQLRGYSISLWENNEKMDMLKVYSIIDSVVIRQ